MSKYFLLILSLAIATPHTSFADDATDALNAAKKTRDEALAKQKAEQAVEARRQQQIASQAAAQKSAAKKQQDSGQMAQMLGQGLQVVGTMTMLAGSLANNQTMKDIGMYAMMGGMAAGLAGMFMKKKGDEAATNAGDLNSLGDLGNPNLPNPNDPGGSSSNGGGTTTNLGDIAKNDPPGLIALNPNEEAAKKRLDDLYKQFEQTTGIPASELRSALESGKSPLDFLDGRNGLSKEKLQADMAKMQASSGFSGSAEELKGLADKIGMGDLAANLVDPEGSDYSGGGSMKNAGGGGASSLPPLDFASLLPPKPEEGARSPASTTFDFQRDVSPEIQKKLLAQGVVQGTIFQMVSSRYRQMAPVLLGYGPSERKN